MVRLMARLLPKGAVHVSGGTWQIDLSGRCQKPVTVERTVRPPARYRRAVRVSAESDEHVSAVLAAFPGAEVIRDDRLSGRTTEAGWEKYVTIRPGETGHTLTLRMETQCRQCPECLKDRQRLWMARARQEFSTSVRTWLGTLTLSPESHYTALSRARWLSSRSGDEFELLSEKQQYAYRHRAISPWLTLWLKRVRKEVGSRSFRYLLVAEAHKSGLPHFHVLIHEQRVDAPVRKRTLTDQWPHGFSKFKLCEDADGATYAAKYLSKDAMARVRASGAYGSNDPRSSIIAEREKKLDPQSKGSPLPDNGLGVQCPEPLPTAGLV